jgi:hypothetical protein
MSRERRRDRMQERAQLRGVLAAERPLEMRLRFGPPSLSAL